MDQSQQQLQTIQQTRTHPDPKVIADLRKRKLLELKKVITFEVSKGPKFAKEFVKEETDLTADMLARYGARMTCGVPFAYGVIVAAPGKLCTSSLTTSKRRELRRLVEPCIPVGCDLFLDPDRSLIGRVVNKVRHEFRQIFFEMGFQEMPTTK